MYVGVAGSLAVLEITVGHWPLSDQIQYLTEQNSFCSDKFTVPFQWKGHQKVAIFKKV